MVLRSFAFFSCANEITGIPHRLIVFFCYWIDAFIFWLRHFHFTPFARSQPLAQEKPQKLSMRCLIARNGSSSGRNREVCGCVLHRWWFYLIRILSAYRYVSIDLFTCIYIKRNFELKCSLQSLGVEWNGKGYFFSIIHGKNFLPQRHPPANSFAFQLWIR